MTNEIPHTYTMKMTRHIFSLCAAIALTVAPVAAVAADAQQPEVVSRQDAPQVKVRAGGISIDKMRHCQAIRLFHQEFLQYS